MNGTKPWYTSTGVWGALVALLSSVLTWFKLNVSPDLLADIQAWVLNVITVISAGIALYGRFTATRRIKVVDDGSPPAPASRSLGLLLMLLVAVGAGGGGGGCLPSQAYVAADRATFEAVAPAHLIYVAKDPDLDVEQKARRVRTIETWDLRLRQAEKQQAAAPIGKPAPPASPATPATTQPGP
jgi:hypothetical protein